MVSLLIATRTYPFFQLGVVEIPAELNIARKCFNLQKYGSDNGYVYDPRLFVVKKVIGSNLDPTLRRN